MLRRYLFEITLATLIMCGLIALFLFIVHIRNASSSMCIT